MEQQHIDTLLSGGIVEGQKQELELIETHISWLILADGFVYKIKKPIRYPFLDFSSIEQRKFFCEQELLLNRRLSDIYLDLIPVYDFEGKIILGKSQGKLLDFAVKMKRMDASRKMDVYLSSGKIGKNHIEKLAQKVTDFHQAQEAIVKDIDLNQYKEDFNDFWKLESQLADLLGKEAQDLLKSSINMSDRFLTQHEAMIELRIKKGYVRDVHGDLHAKNIFIYDDPVIFDCIEFNDSFRQIDVLNDVAFFCMDLEANGAHEMSDYFMDLYVQKFPCINSAEEILLFIYFKAYRANVRAKVNLLRAMQAENTQPHTEEAWKYLQLMGNYMLEIEEIKSREIVNR